MHTKRDRDGEDVSQNVHSGYLRSGKGMADFYSFFVFFSILKLSYSENLLLHFVLPKRISIHYYKFIPNCFRNWPQKEKKPM